VKIEAAKAEIELEMEYFRAWSQRLMRAVHFYSTSSKQMSEFLAL
jgi:hypothetical protein